MFQRNELINVFLVAIVTVIANTVVAAILIILSIPLLQSILVIGFTLLYAGLLIGIFQLLYIIPLCIYWHRKQKPAIVKGIIVGSALTVLLSGTCWLAFINASR